MSMKRTKQRTTGSDKSPDADIPPWGKAPDPEPTWADVEAKPEGSFVPFVLSTRYGKGSLFVHPKFGKGLVLGVEGTRIEVLFHDGKKKLGLVVS